MKKSENQSVVEEKKVEVEESKKEENVIKESQE